MSKIKLFLGQIFSISWTWFKFSDIKKKKYNICKRIMSDNSLQESLKEIKTVRCKRCDSLIEEKNLVIRYHYGVLDGGEHSIKDFDCPKCHFTIYWHSCLNEEVF